MPLISLPRHQTALAITVIASALLSEILAHGGAAKIRYLNRKNIDQLATTLEIDPLRPLKPHPLTPNTKATMENEKGEIVDL